MRRGKEIAQGSHASMEFIIAHLRSAERERVVEVNLDQTEISWIRTGTKKICLQVSNEHELMEAHQNALTHGLRSHLVRDSGKTEFGGVPTFTACAIGPNFSDEIDKITEALKLY